MQKLLLVAFSLIALAGCGSSHDHVLVANDSVWLLDGNQINSANELKSKLKELTGNSVLIASCASTKHQHITDTINIVSGAGIENVGLNSAYQSTPCN